MSADHEAHFVTDGWFDNDTPNDLHPMGVIIDPRTRLIEVPMDVGTVVASSPGQRPVGYQIGAVGANGRWTARVGDIVLIFKRFPSPTLRELWRD